MTELDRPWTRTMLGVACTVNPKKPRLAGVPDDTPVLFVPMASVDEMRGEITAPHQKTLGDVRMKSYTTFAPDDVIFAKITPCMENGKSAVVPAIGSGLGFGSTEFHVLRPTKGVNPRFVWHLVRQESFRRDAEAHMTGSVGQARVPAAFLDNFPISLPPEALQSEIVEVLDATQEVHRNATDHLTSARRAIDRFRQAILAAACSGELTAQWRLSRGRSFATDLNRGQTQPNDSDDLDVPAEWRTSLMDELCTKITSGSRDWTPYYGRGAGTFVMAQNVRRGSIDWSYRQAVDPPVADSARDRSQIRMGDLLVTIVGANTGDVGLVNEDRPRHYVCQSVALMRPRNISVTPFLNLWYSSLRHGRKYLMECAYGAGRPHLSFVHLRNAPIALPSQEEQDEIVRRVGALEAFADHVLARIDKATRSLSDCASATIETVFSGRATELLVAGSEGD